MSLADSSAAASTPELPQLRAKPLRLGEPRKPTRSDRKKAAIHAVVAAVRKEAPMPERKLATTIEMAPSLTGRALSQENPLPAYAILMLSYAECSAVLDAMRVWKRDERDAADRGPEALAAFHAEQLTKADSGFQAAPNRTVGSHIVNSGRGSRG